MKKYMRKDGRIYKLLGSNGYVRLHGHKKSYKSFTKYTSMDVDDFNDTQSSLAVLLMIFVVL